MERFSKRNRYGSSRPRTLEEEAPRRVRSELRDILIDRLGAVGAHKRICDVMYLDDEGVFSADWATPRIKENLDDMDWFRVYDLFEEMAEGLHYGQESEYHDAVNAAFAEAGVVYELRDGVVERLDETGEALGVRHDEDAALSVLTGPFKPVQEQYRKALDALHGRPAEPKAAIRESLNAVEAVTRIITGKEKSQLGECITVIYGKDAEDHHKALAQSLKSLYGYASSIPGARHGQHADVEVSFEEALLAVRMSGAAIAFLIAEHSSSRGAAATDITKGRFKL
ncbi:AbiJ-NTD4 domain-containing protein [Arthrobacter sp. MMS18-M83]|uniref:AbiJ-NTD4 domain-containing protein n=1 Tax=Arthrobacter sp. MMS18-M83 TaxID=2996261 RepID=UPI00227A5DA5|nr:hypothetical protein [Arthrobacter sp. MMS18-M83]WAH99736.1 hypothetical protein OW521_24045 [Arthrobacter sp. MMS18-M83]